MTKGELIAFEDEIASLWEAGKIRAPVHLVGGNENRLIDIFSQIKPDDWVFSTHRSHYHALLKGIPSDKVRSEILAGHSICLRFPEYHFYSSAIVGGNLPQAVGVAMTGHKVWCFSGDMAAQTGIFSECVRFSWKNQLPINFVVEDNGKSVQTPTYEVWPIGARLSPRVTIYTYVNAWPHQGVGKFVIF